MKKHNMEFVEIVTRAVSQDTKQVKIQNNRSNEQAILLRMLYCKKLSLFVFLHLPSNNNKIRNSFCPLNPESANDIERDIHFLYMYYFLWVHWFVRWLIWDFLSFSLSLSFLLCVLGVCVCLWNVDNYCKDNNAIYNFIVSTGCRFRCYHCYCSSL